MSDAMSKRLTPEEHELIKKQEELLVLEYSLTQRELELATLQAELHDFERRYLRLVGVLYAQLDDIEARILETQSRLKPNDQKLHEQAAQARVQAQESAHTSGIAFERKTEKEFKSSESLKKLYREVAKAIHPDLTTDEKERVRREKLMAEANLAYEEGNEAKLQSILSEWKSSPESVKGDGPGAELVRIIRKIAQVEQRMRSIKEEIANIQTSDINQLRMKAWAKEREGRDLLTEMALLVTNQIGEAKQCLAASEGTAYERL
ncbi:MAG: J domain-containing protein [Deltaproteobacteria bacterium]